jgi:hypothetical protein
MKRIDSFSWRLVAGGALVATLGSAMPAAAQTVSGQARAIQTSIVDSLGGITTTMLGDTGTLGGATDWREASAPAGTVTSIISGNTLHATTIGWPDQVDSEASVSDLAIRVGVTTISADFVMARSSALLGLSNTNNVGIDRLSINGTQVAVTGNPNQTITIPGGRVVINEQPATSAGTVVNALHISVAGVADVVVASATARVQ